MRRWRGTTAIVLGLVVVLVGGTLAAASTPRSGKPPADDIGITDDEIRVAIVADVENPAVPGLFQSGVDAVRAWAKLLNKKGGLAGREVVVDFIDSKLSADEARNAVIKACAEDFAMVGTEALFLNNVDDQVACPDARGNPVGIPDTPGIALEPVQRCSPVTFIYSGDNKFCDTKDENPQTYYPQRGDFRYYLKKHKDLHGVFTIPNDLKSARDAVLPLAEAGVDAGIEKDAQGFYDVSSRSTQNQLTPIVQVAKDNESNFFYNSSAFPVMVLLRREAKLQGLSSVKVWACNQGCYDNQFIDQGGADVEGTHAILTSLPFYSEYKQNPALKALVKELGGVDNVNANAINAWVGARLFQEAVERAVADGGTLTRESVLDALVGIHDFDADGVIGKTDTGNHEPPYCIVMVQVKNGKWTRVHPAKAGTFDCSKKNVAPLELDLTA
jgi:ABC-type branched-subunit amino acid transport system substrate-binding protein